MQHIGQSIQGNLLIEMTYEEATELSRLLRVLHGYSSHAISVGVPFGKSTTVFVEKDSSVQLRNLTSVLLVSNKSKQLRELAEELESVFADEGV